MKRTLIFAAVLLAAFFSSAGPSRSSEPVGDLADGSYVVQVDNAASVVDFLNRINRANGVHAKLEHLQTATVASLDEACRERFGEDALFLAWIYPDGEGDHAMPVGKSCWTPTIPPVKPRAEALCEELSMHLAWIKGKRFACSRTI